MDHGYTEMATQGQGSWTVIIHQGHSWGVSSHPAKGAVVQRLAEETVTCTCTVTGTFKSLAFPRKPYLMQKSPIN